MPISGSFIRGDSAGRVMAFNAVYDRLSTSSSKAISTTGAVYNILSESSSIQSLQKRNRSESEIFVIGAAQGISIGDSGTIDGNGSFGRYIQIGVNKEISDGSPTAPSLRLDYPGNMWRFRWVIKSGPRSIKISAKQNSTGSSFRPSIIVKANPTVNILYDLSASIADGSDWIVAGPITFTASGSDVLWVELHNNNFGIINDNGIIQYAPAYFDHIVVT